MMDLEPFGRIQELRLFYVTGNVSVVQYDVEELPASKKVSEESSGIWATEQMLIAAKALDVEVFILPKDKGGVDLPVVRDQDEYVEVHLKLKKSVIEKLEEAFPIMERNIRHALNEMVIAEEAVRRLESKDVPIAPEETGDEAWDNEARKAYLRCLKDMVAEVSGAKKVLSEKQRDWGRMHSEFQKDMQKVDDWRANARENGMSQWSNDVDAWARAIGCLQALKRVVAGLMKKVPALEDVVRQMGQDNGDPYDEGNMRGVYANLLERFCNRGQLNVATTIMSGMREIQGTQTLTAYVRRMEEFLRTITRLGVTTVSVADLVAMVAISGFQDSAREEFLRAETTLASMLSALGESASKKTLFHKVKEFAVSDANRRWLSSKFMGSVSKPCEPTAEGGSKPDQARARVCYNFARGACRWGDGCRFSHDKTNGRWGGIAGGRHRGMVPGEAGAPAGVVSEPVQLPTKAASVPQAVGSVAGGGKKENLTVSTGLRQDGVVTHGGSPVKRQQWGKIPWGKLLGDGEYRRNRIGARWSWKTGSKTRVGDENNENDAMWSRDGGKTDERGGEWGVMSGDGTVWNRASRRRSWKKLQACGLPMLREFWRV
jgi:hypothetical protein